MDSSDCDTSTKFGSRWPSALEANITTSGRANSMLEGGQVTQTRWAHHVIVASLNVLQRAEYQQYLDMHLADDALPTFHECYKTQSEVQPQFLYWSTTISLEFMQFVGSLREGNFQLYVETLKKLAPWFCAMDIRTTRDGC